MYLPTLRALFSLNAQDPAAAIEALQMLSPAVRTQDTGQLIGGLLGGPWGREAAWAFTKARWSDLVAKLGTFQGIPAIVGGLGAFCSAAQTAADIRQFFLQEPRADLEPIAPAGARANRDLCRADRAAVSADDTLGWPTQM